MVRIYQMQLATAEADAVSEPGSNVSTSVVFSYSVSLALLWSAMEVNVGITCACIPLLRPLIRSTPIRRVRSLNPCTRMMSAIFPSRHFGGHGPPRQRDMELWGQNAQGTSAEEQDHTTEQAQSPGAKSKSVSFTYSTIHSNRGSFAQREIKSMLDMNGKVAEILRCCLHHLRAVEIQ